MFGGNGRRMRGPVSRRKNDGNRSQHRPENPILDPAFQEPLQPGSGRKIEIDQRLNERGVGNCQDRDHHEFAGCGGGAVPGSE